MHIGSIAFLGLAAFALLALYRARAAVRLCWRGLRLPGRLTLAGDQFAALSSLAASHGPVARYWDGLDLHVLVSEPALLRDLSPGLDGLEKTSEGLRFMSGLCLGPSSSAFAYHEEGKRRRQVYHATVSSDKHLSALCTRSVALTTAAIQGWLCEQELDFQAAIRPLWFRLNLPNAFGLAACDVDPLPLYALFQEGFHTLRALRQAGGSSWLPVLSPASRRKVKELAAKKGELQALMTAELEGLITSVISQAAPEGPGGVLGGMLQQRGPDGKPRYSAAEVLDEVQTMLFAVADNHNLVSFALFALAQNPEAQAEARREVDALWEGRVPSSKRDLTALKYLRAVLKETLRQHAGASIMWRRVTRDTPCGRHTIPQGATLVVASQVLHHEPSLWPDPERFQPARFLHEAPQQPPQGGAAEPQAQPHVGAAEPQAQPHVGAAEPQAQLHVGAAGPGRWTEKQPDKYTFLPFGFGKRTCLGQMYALDAAALVLGLVLQRCHVSPAQRAQHAPTLREENLTHLAAEGLWLRFEPR